MFLKCLIKTTFNLHIFGGRSTVRKQARRAQVTRLGLHGKAVMKQDYLFFPLLTRGMQAKLQSSVSVAPKVQNIPALFCATQINHAESVDQVGPPTVWNAVPSLGKALRSQELSVRTKMWVRLDPRFTIVLPPPVVSHTGLTEATITCGGHLL